jgi:mRNA interferase RelE/StbE
MRYQIRIKPQAEKALAGLDHAVRRRIARAIGRLSECPRPAGCAKLTGAKDAYRIRVGDYRVVYQIEDRVLVVYVIRIAHRRDVYRRL